MEIIFVTQNKGKVDVAQKLLDGTGIVVRHIDFDVPEIQSMDPHEIVSFKLKYAYNHVRKPCYVIDDSLFMDCLNGFPGPFIKWFYDKTVGPVKTCQIANLFKQYGVTWKSVLGYFDGKNVQFIEEVVMGSIATEPRGTNGFAWDPIFIPNGETRTFAEMSFEDKHKFTTSSKLYARLEELIINR